VVVVKVWGGNALTDNIIKYGKAHTGGGGWWWHL